MAIISVEGMPLSSLRMSGSTAAAEEEFRDAHGPCECCIAVAVSLRHEQYSGSPRARREPEESVALVPCNNRSHALCFSVLLGAYLVPSVQGSLYQQLSVLLNAV